MRSKELKKLLEGVSGRQVEMPSIPITMTAMKNRFDSMKIKLKKQVSLQSYVCCTADIWSHMRRSYLGVSLHYIDENWQRKSYILAFRYLNKRHTFDYLAECLAAIFEEYHIPVDKITHTLTDGSSNFCKAFKEFGKSNDFSETLEFVEQNDIDADSGEEDNIIINENHPILVLDNDINSENLVEDEVNEQSIENEIQKANIQGNQINFPEEYDELDTDILLPPQMRCFAHLLNLLGKKKMFISNNSMTHFSFQI